jgi:hypothetical protein
VNHYNEARFYKNGSLNSSFRRVSRRGLQNSRYIAIDSHPDHPAPPNHFPQVKPELGDSGDLYLSIAEIIAHSLPLACVFENVPAFGNSLACMSLAQHLRRIG